MAFFYDDLTVQNPRIKNTIFKDQPRAAGLQPAGPNQLPVSLLNAPPTPNAPNISGPQRLKKPWKHVLDEYHSSDLCVHCWKYHIPSCRGSAFRSTAHGYEGLGNADVQH